MKIDLINLMHAGADALHRRGDGGRAYALHEAANNLRLLMLGEEKVEDWNKVYVGQDRPAFDIDAHMDAIRPAPDARANVEREDEDA